MGGLHVDLIEDPSVPFSANQISVTLLKGTTPTSSASTALAVGPLTVSNATVVSGSNTSTNISLVAGDLIAWQVTQTTGAPFVIISISAYCN
jgi:hypothetical protein